MNMTDKEKIELFDNIKNQFLSELFIIRIDYYYQDEDEESTLFIRMKWVTRDNDGIYINKQIKDDDHFIAWGNIKAIEIDKK